MATEGEATLDRQPAARDDTNDRVEVAGNRAVYVHSQRLMQLSVSLPVNQDRSCLFHSLCQVAIWPVGCLYPLL